VIEREGLSMAVRKVAITLPEELFEIVERARVIEHRSRSEVVQEALRTHFGEAVYVPSEEERQSLAAALDEADGGTDLVSWDEVRSGLRGER
jgi:metal-responsive CopG/Arc/MetJ family transcriptional regulator